MTGSTNISAKGWRGCGTSIRNVTRSWHSAFWKQGLGGILADEMGLGKTVQTATFLASLKLTEQGPRPEKEALC